MRFFVISLLACLALARVNIDCFGQIPQGSQFNKVKNIVSAAVLGTTLGKQLKTINNANLNAKYFPDGFDWTDRGMVMGLVSNPLTADWFNGKRLTGSSYYQVFNYSPMADTECGVTGDYNYTGSFLSAIANADSSSAPNINCSQSDETLIDHLTMQVASMMGCDDFESDLYYGVDFIRQYDVNDVFRSMESPYDISGLYHRNMNLTVDVLDAFNDEMRAAMSAHQIPESSANGLEYHFKLYFYIGNSSMISLDNLDCGKGWYLYNETLSGERVILCASDAMSHFSRALAAIALLLALLF